MGLPSSIGGRSELPRVLLISPLPPPYGGIARWTKTMVELPAETVGARLTLVNTAHHEQRSDETTFLKRVTTGLAQVIRTIGPFLKHVCQRPRVRCVHVNSSGSLGLFRDNLVLLLSRVFNLRSVLHLRFGRAPEVLRGIGLESLLLRLAIRLASATISIDRPSHQAVTKVALPHRSVLIPNFIDVASYAVRDDARHRVVLFVGSVSRSKGVAELLEAWREVALEGWTLRLVGPLSPTMESVVEECRGDRSVEFVGPLEHTEAVTQMYMASILVLPSHTEGFPNVVLEGMAIGIPVIATAVGAVPEMLENGAGIVVPPKDVRALARAIHVLANDECVRLDIARRAREAVTEKFSTDAVMQQYAEVWTRDST